MRILYGIQATGNGHISRSREIVSKLKAIGHEVSVIFSGRDPNLLKEVEIFKPYVAFQGLTFYTSKGRVEYLKTLSQLNIIRIFKDIFSYKATDFDLVITDFEPISAGIAKWNKILSIGISHQYAFCHKVPLVPGKRLSYAVLKNFALADYLIGLHWYHFDQPILPPIIPDYLEQNCKEVPRKVLVYLPFEAPEDIQRLLTPLDNYQFHIYNSKPLTENPGHLHYHSHSRQAFLKSLVESEAVICNAGFQLCSEALHLGKRLLIKPLLQQIEQESNALTLSHLNLAEIIEEFDKDVIQEWLQKDLKRPPVFNYPNVAQYLAEWITQARWDTLQDLVETLWKKTPSLYYDEEHNK